MLFTRGQFNQSFCSVEAGVYQVAFTGTSYAKKQAITIIFYWHIIWELLFHSSLNFTDMGNLLYFVAVILVIAWAIGFLGFHAGGLIHIVLVIAVIAFVIQIISGRKV